MKFVNLPVSSLTFLLALNMSVGSLEAAPVKAPAPAKTPAVKKPVVKIQTGGPSKAAVESYCGHVWNKIYSKWILPDGNNHVTLTAEIGSDGSLGDISANSTPKNAEAEAAAMTALDQAKPLDLLPSGMNSGKLTINFNSKADPHGDSSSGGSVRLDPISVSASGGQ